MSHPENDADALERSQAWLRKAVAVAKLGFYDWDVQNDIVTYSDQMKLDWGIERSGSLQDAIELIHPEDRALVAELIQASLLRGEPYSAEYRVRRPDGTVIWVAAEGDVKLHGESGKPLRFFGVCRDITEQKRREDQSRAIMELAPQFVWLSDANGSMLYTNAQMVAYFGKDEESLTGDSWLETLHPDDRARTMAAWQQSVAGNTLYEIEFRLRDKHGRYNWFLNRAKPLKDKLGGNVDRWLGISFNITDRVNAENKLKAEIAKLEKTELELKASEQRFRTYAEAMPHMAFIANERGGITYFNQQFFDYAGVGRESEGWGWADYQIVDGEDLARTLETWRKSLETGEPYRIEYRLKRHDGEVRWHLARAAPQLDSTGKIVQWLGTITDIHDQKRDQELLQEALHARDELLSICSHELRTPVTSMKLSTQIFKRRLAKDPASVLSVEKIQRMADQTERQLDRLTRLIEEMLDFSRISSGNLQLDRQSSDLCEIVSDTFEQTKPQFDAASVDVTFERCDDIIGDWDRFRLEQVIANLLSNALKYGAGKPVRVTLRSEGGVALLSVCDAGIGISAADRERIFEPYERAVSVNNISGLGMGLYISAQIVQGHGGTLRVQSEINRGSTFIVALPLMVNKTVSRK